MKTTIAVGLLAFGLLMLAWQWGAVDEVLRGFWELGAVDEALRWLSR